MSSPISAVSFKTVFVDNEQGQPAINSVLSTELFDRYLNG